MTPASVQATYETVNRKTKRRQEALLYTGGEDKTSSVEFWSQITWSEEAWVAYQAANRKYAKAVAKDIKDGDCVWIHDFHLMLLPAMLREELGKDFNVKIGFFLHTPFPSSEIYRILPVRKEILRGVLECDLLGFHTQDYARHFLSSCSIVL